MKLQQTDRQTNVGYYITFLTDVNDVYRIIIILDQKSEFSGDCVGGVRAPLTSPAAKSSTSGISRRADVMLPPPSHQSTSAFYG